MDIILRSIVRANDEDLAELNANVRYLISIDFEIADKDQNSVLHYVKEFLNENGHVPDRSVVRMVYTQDQLPSVVDALEGAMKVKPLFGGNFIAYVKNRITDQRKALVVTELTTAQNIVTKGVTFKEGREEVHLAGAEAAIEYLINKTGGILAPIGRSRLSGDLHEDGSDFTKEYLKKKNDEDYNRAARTGLGQIDSTLRGAKRKHLWTHAAFTGHLKCLSGDTRIYDRLTNSYKRIADFYTAGQPLRVHALDEDDLKITYADTLPIQENGIKPVFELVTKAGRRIKATGNHPFLTARGWVPLEDLGVGQHVAIPVRIPTPDLKESNVSLEDIALCGLLSAKRGLKRLCDPDRIVSQLPFFKTLQAMGISEPSPTESLAEKYYWGDKLTAVKQKYGYPEEGRYTPSFVWGLPDDKLWFYISSLWEDGGYISVNDDHDGENSRLYIFLDAKEQLEFLGGIQLLLQRLGVRTAIVHDKGSDYRDKLWISGGDSQKLFLAKLTGFRQSRVDIIHALYSFNVPDHRDASYPLEIVESRLQRGAPLPVPLQSNKSYSRDKLKKVAEYLGDEVLETLYHSDIVFDEIRSIKPIGEEMTYDLSVPKYHNFIANGFITHNTTTMLNWAYTLAIYDRKNSVIFSLEVPYEQCRDNLVALHSGHEKFKSVHPPLPYERIRDAQLTDREEEFLLGTVIPDLSSEKYGHIKIEVAPADKQDFRISDIRTKAEQLNALRPFDILFVDHALLVSPRKYVQNPTDRLNEVIRDSKKMAMYFNKGEGMAVVLLFQMSREAYKAGLKARESGSNYVYNLTGLSYANEAERCLQADNFAFTPHGAIRMKDIQEGDQVWSSTGWKTVNKKFDNGHREIWEIQTDRGSLLECTGKHRVRVLTDNGIGWKEAQALETTDYVVGALNNAPFPTKYPEFPELDWLRYEHTVDRNGDEIKAPTQMTENLAYLLGAWHGDGAMYADGIGFTGNRLEESVRDRILNCIQTEFSQLTTLSQKPSRAGSFDHRKHSRPIKRWFEAISGKRGIEIPEVILRSPKECVSAFLQGLFDTDGWVNSQGCVGIHMKKAADPLVRSVQALLNQLGVESSLKYGDKYLEKTDKSYPYVILRVRSREGRRQFQSVVGFTEPWKATRLQEEIDKRDNIRQRDVQVYPVVETFKRFYRVLPLVNREKLYDAVKKGNKSGVIVKSAIEYALSQFDLLGMTDTQDSLFLKSILRLDIMRVQSVRKTDRVEQVYDLEVGGDFEYQTGPILSHNSSDIVTTSWLDPELSKDGKVLYQMLKSRDDKGFEPFCAQIQWINKRLYTLNDLLPGQTEEAAADIDLLNS